MFHSLSRPVVSAVLILAFLLSAIPAQAQPRDFGSSTSLDISWAEAALSWLEGLLRNDSATGDKKTDDDGVKARLMGGACIDPSGNCVEG